MQLVVTDDIDKKVISNIRKQLNITEDTRYFLQKSQNEETIVKIIGEIFEWHSLLKIALIAFIGEISVKSVEGLYKNKSVILKALKKSAVKPFNKFVKLIHKTKKKCSTNTKLVVCLPILDEFLGTELEISDEDELIIAWKLANYFYKAEHIKNFEVNYMKDSKYPMGKVYVKVKEDGSLLLQWFNKNDVGTQEKIIN